MVQSTIDNQEYRSKNHWNFVYWTTAASDHLFRQALRLPGNKPTALFTILL